MSNKRMSKDMRSYLETLDRAVRLANIDRQLNAGDLSTIRGPMVLAPYGRTIAELGVYRPRNAPTST